MASQFDFLKEYSELAKYHSQFVQAEEYLYDNPQATCLQLGTLIEDFAKFLCRENGIVLPPKGAGNKAINELDNRGIIDCELTYHARIVMEERNTSTHKNISDEEKAKEALKNCFLFCKKYIKKHSDPLIAIDYYRIPSKAIIDNRIIEKLGLPDLTAEINGLNVKLKEMEALCSAKDQTISEQIGQIHNLDTLVAGFQKKEEERKAKYSSIVPLDSDYLKDLNDNQKQAVLETEGFVRVLAGPGTGKTKTLVRRFVHLVVSKHIQSNNILCLTFTNKAAEEMRTRIGKWLGACDLSQVCTFHSLCFRIVSENANKLNISADSIILDSDEKTAIIEEIRDKMEIDSTDREYSVSRIKKAIEFFKNGRQRQKYLELLFGNSIESIEAAIRSSTTPMDEICYRFLYEQRLSSLLEFDDLIHATSYLFFTHPELLDEWQRRIQYIMVDEYQDVNSFQANMCQCLAGINHNLFVVGDPNQTIYSWRHADVRFIETFPVDDSNKDIVLMENYRSTPEILHAAQNLIQKQSSFSFRSCMPSGEIPEFFQAKTRSEEAEWIVNKMAHLANQGVPKNEIAVLFRNSYSSQRIELELLKQHLPYRVIGGNAFYNSKEIKTIMSYLQLIAYDNDFAFKKIIGKPSRGIGGKTIEKLNLIRHRNNTSLFESLKYALNNNPTEVFSTENAVKKAKEFVLFVESVRQKINTVSLSQIVSDVVEKSGYSALLTDNGDDNGLRNLIELLATIQTKEREKAFIGMKEYTVQDYLKEIATYSSTDNSGNKDVFILSTIHGAKGLEYKYVIICGLEENTFPTEFKYRNGTITTEVEHLYEERRLCFVALTRATKGVFITNALSQNNSGPEDCLVPSRFISEIQG